MKGRYDIVLYNNKVHYSLTVKRNITVLRGDSAPEELGVNIIQSFASKLTAFQCPWLYVRTTSSAAALRSDSW